MQAPSPITRSVTIATEQSFRIAYLAKTHGHTIDETHHRILKQRIYAEAQACSLVCHHNNINLNNHAKRNFNQ
eukprot:scaffold175761_cov30-Prasinocladus_malaysianus.AAC.2